MQVTIKNVRTSIRDNNSLLFCLEDIFKILEINNKRKQKKFMNLLNEKFKSFASITISTMKGRYTLMYLTLEQLDYLMKIYKQAKNKEKNRIDEKIKYNIPY